MAGSADFFKYESGVRADMLPGKTGGRGQTPGARRPGPCPYVSAASVVTANGAFCFSAYEAGLTTELLVELLEKVTNYRLNAIYRIPDSLPGHTIALVKKYVASTEGCLALQ